MPPARLRDPLPNPQHSTTLCGTGFPPAPITRHRPSRTPPCFPAPTLPGLSCTSPNEPQLCPAAPLDLSTAPRPLLPTNPNLNLYFFLGLPKSSAHPGGVNPGPSSPPAAQLPAQHPSCYSKHPCSRDASALQACCSVHQHPLGMRRNSRSAFQDPAPTAGSHGPVDKTNSPKPERTSGNKCRESQETEMEPGQLRALQILARPETSWLLLDIAKK